MTPSAWGRAARAPLSGRTRPMLFALLAFAFALGTLAPTVGANATLVHADPLPDGAAAENATRITLRFSERLDPRASDADLFDLTGRSWRAQAPVEVEGDRLHLPTRPLEPGTYSVAWRTLGADGHTARGSYYVHVGEPQVAPAGSTSEPDQETYPAHEAEAATRAVHAALALVALGLAAAPLVVAPEAARPRWTRQAAAAFAAASALAGALGLLYLSDRAGLEVADAALATLAGQGLLLRALLLGGAAVALALARPGHPPLVPLALMALGGASLAFSAHAGLLGLERAVATLADLVHLASGAMLVALAVQRLDHTPVPPRRVAAALAATVAGAALATSFHVPRLADVWGSAYGRGVLLQLALLALAGLALLAPSLALRVPSANGGSVAAPRTSPSAGLPAALALLALLVGGGLGAASPPLAPAAVADVPEPLTLDAYADRVHVLVVLDPAPVPDVPTDVAVYLHALVRNAVTNETRVLAALEPPGAAAGSTPLAPLERAALNEWRLDDARLDEPGGWTLRLRLELADAPPQTLDFPILLNPPPGETP